MAGPGIIEGVECGALRSVFLLLSRSPRENAGLLTGRAEGGRVQCSGLVMVRNVEESPVRFTMDPWGVVVAHKAAWALGLDVVGVFHTHPCGEPRPSMVDVRFMKLWPMPWVIASPRGVGAWALRGGRVVELELL